MRENPADPILKSHWERHKTHVELNLTTVQSLIAPYTLEPVADIQWLSNGCANTNYKVMFQGDAHPVVLRLYTREKTALEREVALHRWLADKFPIPKPLYENCSCTLLEYPYAIMTWMEGTLMRDILLSGDNIAIHDCAFEAGRYLNQLRQLTLNQGGFFQTDLSIKPFDESEKYQPFVLGLLQDPMVKESLSAALQQSIQAWIHQHLKLLPNEQVANLVHGDFDPANILVKKINGQWEITAILDWEFSFSGSYFFDMGTFLRYAHKLPICYEQGFIEGIEADGFKVASTWQIQTKLMDLLCLLQLLHDNPIKSRPNLNRDVVALIEHAMLITNR